MRGLVATAAAGVALDLLDNRLDHQLLLGGAPPGLIL